MSGRTEQEAMRAYCHASLSSGPHEQTKACLASECMAWRWIPLPADQAFLDAIAKQMKVENPATGKPYNNAQASRYVTEHRAEFGLPTAPTHGFCGLAGRP